MSSKPTPFPVERRRGYSELSAEKSPLLATLLREFFIDLMGSLVPGFLFTATAVPLISWSVWLAWKAAQTATHSSATLAVPQIETATAFRVELLCLLLVLAYVLGCIFYRRDPKDPDQKSARYILWRDRHDIERCVIQPVPEENTEGGFHEFRCDDLSFRRLRKVRSLAQLDALIKRWRKSRQLIRALAYGEGGQFPYSHIREYLEARGLQHLADLVPWHGNDLASHRFRTKMFINLLKIRIHYLAPAKCGEIVRNEAHIRLMSSVWHAARALQRLCWVLALPVVVSAIVVRAWRSPDLLVLLFLFALLWAALWLKLTIRKFFHYQRVREIVYVLETAYFAKQNGHPTIFEHLSNADASH